MKRRKVKDMDGETLTESPATRPSGGNGACSSARRKKVRYAAHIVAECEESANQGGNSWSAQRYIVVISIGKQV